MESDKYAFPRMQTLNKEFKGKEGKLAVQNGCCNTFSFILKCQHRDFKRIIKDMIEMKKGHLVWAIVS